jgi:hypothetical protein
VNDHDLTAGPLPHPRAADRHRDPAQVARMTALAGQLLTRFGVDLAVARRAGGFSNLTWLARDLVVRIAPEAGDDGLLREARLAALLPPRAGCPRVIDSGVLEGHAWMVAEQAPGVNLGEVWPRLGWEERARALAGLWERARAVHTTDLSRVAAQVHGRSPFYAPTPAAAAAQVRRLEEQGVLGSAQSAVLLAALDRFWAALPGAALVLNHGDLSPVNALWHQGQVSTLLDFEFAIIAPVELDANELLGAAANPNQEHDLLPDPTGAGRRGLQAAAARVVLPDLQRPGAADRLLGYGVLLHLWATHKWLAEGGGEEDTGWQPHRGLMALTAGDGGHLASVLALLP